MYFQHCRKFHTNKHHVAELSNRPTSECDQISKWEQTWSEIFNSIFGSSLSYKFYISHKISPFQGVEICKLKNQIQAHHMWVVWEVGECFEIPVSLSCVVDDGFGTCWTCWEFSCKSEVNFVIGRRRWKRMVEDPKGRINFFLTQTNLFYNSKHSQQVNMRMMSHVSTTNDDDWLQSRKFMNEWKNLFMLRLILNWLCKYLIKLTTISFLTRWRLIVNKLRIRVLVSLKVNEKEDGKLNDIREKTTTTNVIT